MIHAGLPVSTGGFVIAIIGMTLAIALIGLAAYHYGRHWE